MEKKPTYDEIKSLAPYTDQISLLYYDTSIKSQEKFEQNLSLQLKDIRSWRKEPGASHVQFLIAMGTFINEEPLHGYRDLTIESIPNHISTLKRCLSSIDTPEQRVDGIAIYCEWQTDMEEWDMFRQQWVEGQ